MAHLVGDDPDIGRMDRIVLRFRMAVLVTALRLNDWLIRRFAPQVPIRWSRNEFPWVAELEAATPAIRAELDRFLAAGATMPLVAEISGLDPESDRARREVPATEGAWRTLVLFVNGVWTPALAPHFPVTCAVTREVPALTNVAFSALAGGSHIAEHAAPNRGGFRCQLPVIVPGEVGQCRIRVVDEVIPWREGECVLFDFAEPHEVWNDTDELRVLLMLEVRTPLPRLLDLANRATQRLYRMHPSYQGMETRVEALARGSAAAPSA